MREGWFEIPGQQTGPRTLAEQMLGLDEALAEAKGSTVLDLGCAEGLIALEFLKAGAAHVEGFDVNRGAILAAMRQRDRLGPTDQARVRFLLRNVNEVAPTDVRQFDIVLALAILHKLSPVSTGVEYVARAARKLVVIRLPHGSTGELTSKWRGGGGCDLNEAMPQFGFRLDKMLPGPRGELVQYWRR
jgi:2-polyprenyl-3-methyl-5-hydroxy-6-metoxy-1,4-benzoquinol methylase